MIAVTVPQERSSVLIGKGGRTKELIEKRAHVKLSIFDGSVEISGDTEKEMRAEQIIKAIGRGFPPETALKLLEEDTFLDVITIKGTSNTIKRLASRVIGSQGKAKKNIENLTGASISVYGKTVSLIGSYKEVQRARQAVEMLLMGSRHGSVWVYLEKAKLNELKEKFNLKEMQTEQ